MARNIEGLTILWSISFLAEIEEILAALKLDFDDFSWEDAKEFCEWYYHFKNRGRHENRNG